MASFFTDLVKPYVEKLINGAITKSSYICCFTCVAKDFEEEKARLDVERTTFKQQVDGATSRGEDVHPNAFFWEEDTKTKQKCSFGFCCNCKWRYRRGKELAKKKEQIKKLIETRKELAIGLPAHLPDVERYSSQYYIPFKSRESKCEELLDALNDFNNYIVGLQGMGSIGKTTLAKEVGKKLKQSKQFTQVIDTTVSMWPDIKKIQDDIAGPLGLKFDDCDESDRPKKLWSRLSNGEKILLILDDVWGYIDFDKIGIPYSDNRYGCSVLVTTRNLLVCNKLGCSSIIQLDLLSEDDAWIMFQRYAGLSEVSTKRFLDRGRKIANECKRLPTAIASIASSLKGKQRLEEWDLALRSLQKHMSTHDVDGELDEVYKSLKFSYDNITKQMTKRLFLMCSVFRKDEEIPIEMLTRLGIGAGLLGEDFFNYEDSRSQVVISKNELIYSSLLMEADCNIVKMHPLVHDLAQGLAKKEIQTINLNNKYQKATVEREKNIKYLLCEGKLKDVFSCMPDGSNLEILIVTVDKDEDYHNVKIEVPNLFFENNVGLRVFHLFYDHYPELSLPLPQSIQLLKNIRSLLFTLVDLGDISILGNLQSLETLDLKDCKIDELPHGMAKLEKFRLLNLEGCEIQRNDPFEVIKECSSLEELYFTGSFNAFCREITFPELRRFCIDEFSRLVNDSSSKYVSVLDKDGVFLSETTLKNCMQTAEVLRLRRIEREWRNLIPEIVSMDQGMIDMVELSLSSFSQIQDLIDTKYADFQVPIVFCKLVVLKLDKMENLEELFNGPISFDSLKNLENLSIMDCKHLRSLSKYKLNFCNLKSIKLQNCPMLVSLFQLLTSGSLVLLEKLQIANCEGLENIISNEIREEESREEIDNGDDNDNMSCGTMFPKLKVIDIEECPRLQYILPFLSTQGLENLEKLSIMDCKHLQSLSKCKLNLYNLKTIKLQNCPMLVSLCQLLYSQSLVLLEKLQIANCEGLVNIISDERRDEKSIDEIDDGDGDDNDNKSPGSMFPMLKVLDIEECPRLQYILPFLPTQGLLVLEAIRIRRCDELKYIFGQYHSMFSYRLHIWQRVQCLPIQSYSVCNIKEINLSHFLKMKSVFILSTTPRMLLETLTVTNCDELKNIIIDTVDQDSGGSNWGDVFPKLKRINIGDCIQLEYIFGHYNHGHQNHNEIQLYLPALKHINLCNLPSLVAMSTKQYRTTFPPSAELEHNRCSQVAIKSFPGFVIHPISKSQGIEIIVEEGSTSTNARTITSPTHFEFLCSSSSGQLIAPKHKSTSHDYVDIEGSQETTEINNQGSNIKDDDDDDDRVSKSNKQHLDISYLLHMKNGIVSNNYEIVETEMNATAEGKQEFVVNIPGLVIKMKQRENSEIIVETKMKQTAEANQEFVVNVSGLEILEVANSQKLLNEQSTSQLGEIDTTVKPSQDIKLNLQDITTLVPNAKSITSSTHSEPNISSPGPLVTYEHKTSTQLEGSTSEKTAASAETMSTDSKTKNEADTQFYAPKQKSLKETEKQRIEEGSTSETKNDTPIQLVADFKQKGIKLSFEHGESQETTQINNEGTKNEPPIQLDIAPKQKGIEKSVEERTTTSTYDKTITSSTHLEDGDGKISIPSVSIVNTKSTATKYADIGDSQETIAMEDINTLIDDDPLLAFEKLLTGQASISSIRVLLQELKTLMDSSSDLDHLVSNQESKSKLISLFHQLNKHQGMLTSDLKDFVEKVQDFFNENITKHATSQQVLKKHNQLLDLKSDLMNKLWSAKRTQANIDGETSTANAQIHEFSLQIDDLKSVVKKCDVQKLKLNAECTEWAQQSKELISALASSEVAVREVERARNLAKEDFANLKSSFPTF